MRGEFVSVWSETWREIWLPLIDEPLDEGEESVPGDIFCELYRELAKALKKPTEEGAVVLLLEDAVTLREAFELSAQQGSPDLEFTSISAAFLESGASVITYAEERRAAIEAALTSLIGLPGAPLLEAQLQSFAQDPSRISAVRQRALEPVFNDSKKSAKAFENLRSEDLAGEWAMIRFLESAHGTLEDFGGDELSNRYFNLLDAFIKKFSLRYDLRRPCTLCPTLPGVFTSLVCDLRALTAQDGHLDQLMKDFEESVRDLRIGCTEVRIKTCIQKQVNLLEALGRETLGPSDPKDRCKPALSAIVKQIESWPAEEVRTALNSLYGFACDYPGIRHGGTRECAMRAIDMRDMVAMSILLTGFTPYLSDRLNADQIYQGA